MKSLKFLILILSLAATVSACSGGGGGGDDGGVGTGTPSVPSPSGPGSPGSPVALVPGGDIDGDGVADTADNCILVVNSGQEDLDGNGVGNACQIAGTTGIDVDGDGVVDIKDAFPANVAASLDTDGDGRPDAFNPNVTPDQAGASGLTVDQFPADPNEWADSDADGVGDNSDAFPANSAASVDSDGDGSPDAFNPGVSQVRMAASGLHADAFPTRPEASLDADGDGKPDSFNAQATPEQIAGSPLVLDMDDDNDGLVDALDGLPHDAGRFATYRLSEIAPLSGGSLAIASDINDSGMVVGASNNAPASKILNAVSWNVNSQGVLTNGPTPLHSAGGSSIAFGVNNLGRAVGRLEIVQGRFTSALFKGLNIAPVELPALVPLTGQGTAYSINDHNIVVGQSLDAASNLKAVFWRTNEAGAVIQGPVELGTLGGTSSAAYFISNDETIVGEARNAQGLVRAALWKIDIAGNIVAGPVDLGVLAGDTTSRALGINASGVVVGASGGNLAGLTRAVSWTVDGAGNVAGGPAVLGSQTLPAGRNTIAYAINDSGRMVGTADGAGLQGRTSAVVWDDHLVQNIHEAVFETAANEIKAINSIGQMAGAFSTANGQLHPFVATANFLP